MNWPLPNDYQAAIQNPRNCFTDAELQTGHATLNPLGIPRLSSGNFAVVFELETAARRYAVKCFTREVVDQRQRYATITQYLSGLRLPCLVRFDYLAQGLRLNGALYPLLRMEWVDGELLHQSIERRLAAPAALRTLAEQWRRLSADLLRAGMAHGDLQHRNILVSANRLRLIDYDGLFVPTLRGQPPDERGNDHFQHPQRSKRDYDERLDHFAMLVIYLSLLAVAADPALWAEFHSGENLLLSRPDYEAPATTKVWRRLQASPDPEVRRLSAALAAACRGPVAAVPTLEALCAAAPAAMGTDDWQRLAQALGLEQGAGRPTQNANAWTRPWAVTEPPVAAPPPPAARCPAGHTPPADPTICYCPRCLEQGKRTALYGWRRAPCGHTIPNRAHYCPECRQPTGW